MGSGAQGERESFTPASPGPGQGPDQGRGPQIVNRMLPLAPLSMSVPWKASRVTTGQSYVIQSQALSKQDLAHSTEKAAPQRGTRGGPGFTSESTDKLPTIAVQGVPTIFMVFLTFMVFNNNLQPSLFFVACVPHVHFLIAGLWCGDCRQGQQSA